MSIDVVSLFSGGGGLDYGFKENGYRIVWAIDNQKNAVETYRKNIGSILCGDITTIEPADVPDCDLVVGGPPCQSFSLSGKRNVEDARGQLVWKYMDIIREKHPRAFLFENVTGLLSAKNKNGENIIQLLFEAFREIGYTIAWKVVNAADYGVPQRRKRVIIVGLKGEEGFVFPEPTHSEDGSKGLKYVSVKDAIGDLTGTSAPGCAYAITQEPFSEYQRRMRRPDNLVTEQEMPTMSDLDEYIIRFVRPGGNYMDIPADVPSRRIQRLQREGGHTTCYGRMLPDRPSYTINTYFNRPNVGCNIHYSENRLITVREALRLQSFPDSYELVSGSKQGKHLIVGNAVPPLLAEVFAGALKKYFGEGGRDGGLDGLCKV